MLIVEYVAGFALSAFGQRVLLVRKARPAWQAGKLNAIGGHIEQGENPFDAMRREFREETGLDIDGWRKVCALRGAGFVVHFFSTLLTDRELEAAQTVTDELICNCLIGDVLQERLRTLPNIPWLLAMALSFGAGERAASFDIRER